MHTENPLPSDKDMSKSTKSNFSFSTNCKASFCPETLFTSYPSLDKYSVKFVTIPLSSSTNNIRVIRLPHFAYYIVLIDYITKNACLNKCDIFVTIYLMSSFIVKDNKSLQCFTGRLKSLFLQKIFYSIGEPIIW